MEKTVTGILLATSVLAMATVQQVQAVESGQQRLQQLLRLKKSAMQHIKMVDLSMSKMH